MTIVAISGVGNTGKSSAIHSYRGRDGYKEGIGEHMFGEGKALKIYHETARELFYLLPSDTNNISDYTLFQKVIHHKECHRLHQIELDIQKSLNVVIDRSFQDNIIYMQEAIRQGKAKAFELEDSLDSYELYDKVLLFSEPLQDSTTIDLYNNKEFIDKFNNTIRTKYAGKVEEFRNFKDDYKEIMKFLLSVYK